MPNERRRRDEEDQRVANDRIRNPTRPSDDAVRGRAYEIYERRGGEHGHDWDDWLQAERELQSGEKKADR